MKGYFLIRDYEIPIIPEIQYNDLMDGTPDNISFSFVSDEDISRIINLKEKCEVQIYDSPYPVVGSIDLENNTIVINNINYNIQEEFIYNETSNYVGSIDKESKEFTINDKLYLYSNNIVYEDNRFHYYMCVSQISGEKLSTNYDNGYMITVLLKEQTILLKDCVRTDIAISPSLYPQIDTGKLGSNGQKIYKNIFETLYDATLKIVDCHNMCKLNEQISYIDDDLITSLKDVSCPNLTYRDLSTYSQLNDVFMRIGRVPYFENGTLYGIKLQGTMKENIIDLNVYSHLSSIKEEGVNDNIYSSKVYNNVYDKETAVVPQIFADMVNKPNDGYGIFNVPASGSTTTIPYLGYTMTNVKSPNGTTYPITGSGDVTINGKNYAITTNTNGTPSSIYLINNGNYQFIQFIDSENIFTINGTIYTINGTYTVDENAINEWVRNEYSKWIKLDYQSETDISKTLLFVDNYDYASKGIEDARSYSISLPYKIEDIVNIYSCKPTVEINNTLSEGTQVYFGWKLEKYDTNRIVENTSYEFLSQLQKRITAYYVRGDNKINNIICLEIDKGSESEDGSGNSWNIWNVFNIVSNNDYQGAFAWSTTELYNKLRSQFYVVEYKPILDTIYTNYDYCSDDVNKPLSVNNFNLPYSQVSDRQVYPVLEYNLEKGLDTTTDIKFISKSIDVLNIHAGDIVKYNYEDYIVNKVNMFINNESIECSFSLTKNIIQNSILSSYSDNVRVSSIMSANTTVNRNVHLFAENVIRLLDYNEENAQVRNNNYQYFTQEIGDVLSRHGWFKLGLGLLPTDELNPYKFVSKYPFRFDNIIETDNLEDGEYYIKMSTGSSLDESTKITLTDNDFPVTLYYASKTFPYMEDIEESTEVTVSTPDELSSAIYDFGYGQFTTNIFGWVISSYYLGLRTSSGTTYTLRPDYDSPFWEKDKWEYNILDSAVEAFERNRKLRRTGNYRFYNSSKEYNTTKYGTEKLISTSGLISKIEYAFPDSSYATSEYVTKTLENAGLDYDSQILNSYVYNNVQIQKGTPVYFNTSINGCKLAGIGNKQSDFYSLYALPHISDKAYYLDLRENPRPYIQYKTICRDSEKITIKQLSSEINFLDNSILYRNSVSVYDTFYILKCPKFTHIDTFDIPSTTRELLDNGYLASYTNVTKRISNTESAVIELGTELSKSTEYDYILCGVVLGAYSDEIFGYPILEYKNILKFNIKDSSKVNKLCLKSELYSSINN
jgi:hypothetical protein